MQHRVGAGGISRGIEDVKKKKHHGERGGHGEKPNFDQALLRVLCVLRGAMKSFSQLPGYSIPNRAGSRALTEVLAAEALAPSARTRPAAPIRRGTTSR